MSDYEEDWSNLVWQKVATEAENKWLRSSLVSLLTLAEAEKSPLTNKQVAAICKVALEKREGN